jgi:hypothetical protein
MNTTERRHSICNCYNSIINYILEEKAIERLQANDFNIKKAVTAGDKESV